MNYRKITGHRLGNLFFLQYTTLKDLNEDIKQKIEGYTAKPYFKNTDQNRKVS